MFNFTINGNSLIVTNQENSEIIFEAPKRDFYFGNSELKNNSIQLYDTNGSNEVEGRYFSCLINEALIDGVSANVSNVREFQRFKLGFNTATGGSVVERITINQENVQRILSDPIDSSKEYYLDGIIDLSGLGVNFEIPATGIYIRGHNFDLSGVICSDINFTLFSSPVGGSGNILFFDFFIDINGTGSKVYDITDFNGFSAFELDKINYNNCKSLGDVYNYRQGLEGGTGRFGGSPSLTLHGTWLGGYRITTSIVRNMSDTTTEPLFKSGVSFVMNSRFLTDINVDLGSLQPLFDFSSANFPNSSTLQLKGCIITRDGVSNAGDLSITPNITQKELPSNWDGNIGIPNTFIGGISKVSTEIETILTAINTPSVILGTFTVFDLQHFEQNINYSLKNLGGEPLDYRISFDFVIKGTQSEEYRIYLKKNRGGTISTEFSQLRTIDRLSGGRDVSYFTGTFGLTILKDDFVYWEIENTSSAANCTLEKDSQYIIEER